MNCIHCYPSSGKEDPNVLTEEESIKVLKDLSKIGIEYIFFSGGEPLLRKDIFKLCSVASSLGMKVWVSSNGSLINDLNCRNLKNAGVTYISISLDGSNSTVHDEFRRFPGAFQKALEAIKICKNYGFFICIDITLSKFNFSDFPNILGLVSELNIDMVNFKRFIPMGRGKKI